MTTLQKTVIAAALTAALGTGIYAVRHSAQLNARIQTLQQEQAPLAEQIQQLEQERRQSSIRLAALSEENARLKSGQNTTDLLRLRGEVGALRRQAATNEARTTEPSGGMANLLKNPAMKEYMRKAMSDKMKSLYGDLITELKLTPEQTDQFLELLSGAATKTLAKLTAPAPGSQNQSDAGASQDMAVQLRELLGDEGCARFQEYSEEMPARATVTLLNGQLPTTPLSEEQSTSLIKIIKAEPADLTRGILGGPDAAFMGSQTDIDDFLQQVTDSNQRILQQAGTLLTSDQLSALDSVLTKAIDSRKLQGAAFFPKH